MDTTPRAKRPFEKTLPTDVEADHEEVVRALIEKRPVDPAVAARVRARSDRARAELFAARGVQNIAVDLIREIRGELPTE